MTIENEMNIDFEKLRRRLVARTFLTGIFTGVTSGPASCVNANEATPEQLLNLAKRHGINLEKYKIR